MYVNMREMLDKARKGGYAICAPSNKDEITLRASVDAAIELNAPIIINLGPKAHPDMAFFQRMTRDLALEAPVPVALNQDHGLEYDQAIRAIHSGFTAVMVDRSKLEFEEHIEQVAELTKIAHACNVSVEAELGHVGYNHLEDLDSRSLTDPDKAREFVERTNVDLLAVSIGTIHGTYKGEPHIDFDLLERLKKAVPVPLALHGGSGTGEDKLAKACRQGISKINIGTDVMQAGRDAVLRSEVTAPHFTLPFFYEAYKQELKRYMVMFGSENKA
mgnify:FL=1